MIKMRSLSKSYDGGVSYSVRDVDLEVDAGAFLVLLGESGCGKTTTLKMINRLITPSSGRIEVNGRETARSIRSSFVARSDTFSRESGFFLT